MIVGITGNTGTGKTLITDFFEKWGGYVISADLIGWEILKKHDIIEKLKSMFGDGIIKRKEVDRKLLGEIVFKDKARLKKLNNLVHPVLLKMLKEAIDKSDKPILVIDAALIFEWTIEGWFDYIILIISKPHIIRSRLKMLRISDEIINGKLSSQMNPLKARKYADFIIENNGSVGELREKARDVWERMVGKNR